MQTSTETIITFVIYIAATFVLAILSHRILSKKSFVGEYFLGSRGLGTWALALTFAATSASGGSFTGFPSLIYTHGWILALWIASYMIVPICTMGVMGKRLNQVARKTNAITIPDVIRDRYESTGLALFATLTIIFFTVSNLVAQFKAGAIILEKTFNLPTSWGQIGDQSYAYLVGLLLFAVVVVFYTAYGGFRAVVWTDVMQGVVMGVGVVILLVVVLVDPEVGGLMNANKQIREEYPLAVTSVPGINNDLAYLRKSRSDGPGIPNGVRYVIPKTNPSDLSVDLSPDAKDNNFLWMEVALATDAAGKVISTANDIKKHVLNNLRTKDLFHEIQHALDNDGTKAWANDSTSPRELHWHFIHGDEFIFGPGRRPNGVPFHTLGMVISFFFMWAISGMGQPGTMVRLMAFKESRTLKRAIITVTIYFSLIYLPLVFIFVAARTALPGYIPQEDSDRAMVLVATRVVADQGFWYAILAAIFVAAPFAAVMSTVDSFLLIVSSSLVRDVYQRTVNPNVSEKVMKWASYLTTAVVGVVVTLLATQKIDFLQYIIVFTGGGFASTFLCPVFLGIYWKGMTKYGAYASMVGGFTIVVSCFAPTMFGGSRVNPLGFHPVFWGLFSSLFLAIVVSKLTGPSPQHLVRKYFQVPKHDAE